MVAHSRPTSPDRPAAFSLLELAIVLAIIAIAAAVAAGRYAQSLARWRLDSAARLLASDLTLAQAHARCTSSPATVTFDSASRAYRISGLRDPKTGDPGRIVRLGDPPARIDALAADFGGDATLVFDGFGNPDSDGVIVLSAGPLQKTIALDAGGKAVIR